MNELLVSVILATRDRPGYLRDLLDSLRRSTYPLWETVVVDDASDALEENTRVLTEAGRDITVRLEVNTQTRGTVASLNWGAAVARGKILAFTNDDSVVDAMWLARLVADYTATQVGGVGRRLVTPKPPIPFITLAVVRENSLIIPRVLKSHADATDGITRAELMKRVLECERCGGRMRILAAIHSPEAIRKTLECLGLPSRAPPIARALPDRSVRSTPVGLTL
jgi:glycosyltransferase involved in cell wall biosynthesis